MKVGFFIGIDISKKTLDFAVRNTQQLLFHLKVENSLTGLDTFKSYCQDHEVALEDSLICCEHTGIYSHHVLSLVSQEGISLGLESSIRIKRSIGLQRGKNDKIDAIRISEYAFRYADQAQLWQPEREVLLELKYLVGLRKRLMLAKDTLQVPLKEAIDFQDKELSKKMQALNKKPIQALQKQIQEVEKKIRTLVKEDAALSHLFELITSVSGVGEAAAAL